MNASDKRRRLLGALGACVLLGNTVHPRAEVVPLTGAPRTGAMIIAPGEGLTSGNNLFFQFRVFNIFAGAGESVTFTPPGSGNINNVVTHVSGDPGLFFPGVRASIIDGPLVSQIAGANFFLINPQGIIFGPSAQVHVDGNFFASSADRLEFTEADGSVVSFPDQVSMTSAEPTAFGFLGPNPQPVSVQGAELRPEVPGAVPATMTLGSGGAFTLVGGDVSITDSAAYRAAFPVGAPLKSALLDAPTGGVNLVSAAGAGSVPVNLASAGSVTEYGEITIRDSAVIDAHDVYIRGGRLVIEDSIVAPGSAARLGVPAPAPNGGGVRVHVSGDVTLDGGAKLFGGFGDLVPGITTFNTSAGGDVPAISVEAESLTVRNVSAIRSERKGAGAAPGIALDVGTLELSSGGLISSTNARSGGGADVTVQANSVVVSGAAITASNQLAGGPVGDVPSITVTAAENLTVSDGGVISSLRQGEGGAGAITIDAGALTISSGGIISSVNLFNGPGPDVNVTAGPVQLRGDGGVSPTGLFAQARSASPFGFLQPDSGSITLAASSLTIANGAEITTDSLGLGRGGSIAIDVEGAVALSRDGASKGGILAQSAIAGNAGSVSLRAASLQMRDGFPISAITAGFGDAGSVGLDVAGDITLTGDNTGIFSRAQGVRQEDSDKLAREMRIDLVGFPAPFENFDELLDSFCGGCSLEQLLGLLGVNTDPGGGADVTVQANSVVVSGAAITASNQLAGGPVGDVPSITVTAAENLTVSDGGVISSLRQGEGGAGAITIDAGALTISSGGIISSVNLFNGPGPDVNVTAGPVQLRGDGGVSPTGLFAQARSASPFGFLQPDSGSITLAASSLTIANGAEITTDSLGLGRGGSIAIDVEGAVALSRDGASKGGILAQSAIAGNAGSVSLRAASLQMRDGFPISAITAGFGDAGSVGLDVAGDITLTGDNTGIFSRAQGVRQEDLDKLAREMRIDLAGFPAPFENFDELLDSFCGGCSLEQLLGLLGVNTDPAGGGSIDIAANDLTMNADTRIDSTNASAGGGGDVTVKADSVVLSGGDITTANTSAGGDVPAISVEAGSLTVRNASVIRSERKGAGAARGIALDVGTLEVSSGGLISSTNASAGGGGDVTVKADSVVLSGVSPTQPEKPSAIATSNRLARGPVGDVPSISVVAAENLTVSDGGVISSQRQGQGGPGAITIDAGALTIDSGGIIGSVNLFDGPGADVNVTAGPVQLRGDGGLRPTGLFAQARSVSPAGLTQQPDSGSRLQPDSGSITLAASALTVANGAEITAESLGLGRGGSIAIDVEGAVALSRDGASKGGILAQSAIAGNAGSVSLRAASLQMRDGFPISTITAGFGDAGSVGLDVAGDITLNGDNTGIFSRAQGVQQENLDKLAREMRVDLLGLPEPFESFDELLARFGLTSLNEFLTLLGVNTVPGAGGSIDIAANDLTMNADTRIDASTVTNGPAGDLDVRLRGSLLVADGAQIRGQSGLTKDGVETAGSGAGGELNVQVADLLTISGVSPTQPETPSAITTRALGAGDGGDIFLQSRELRISDGGTVSASSEGTGLAGNITIEASDQVLMDGGTIATEAKVSDGGNITLNTRYLLDLFNSEITTSVESGEGGGGNINIDPDFVVLQNSRIIANAFGGPGGNISIVAGVFIISPDSLVQASSARSVDGIIDIDAPDTDIVASLAALPDTFLDATSLLKGQCDAARGVGGGNSLVVSGRGGVPPEPDGYAPSLAVAARGAERVAGAAAGGSFEVSVEGSGRVMLAHVGVGCA